MSHESRVFSRLSTRGSRLQKWLATSAQGPHPFPFRTRQLSPAAPMVLPLRGGGRVGRCQLLFESPTELCSAGLSAISYELLAHGFATVTPADARLILRS